MFPLGKVGGIVNQVVVDAVGIGGLPVCSLVTVTGQWDWASWAHGVWPSHLLVPHWGWGGQEIMVSKCLENGTARRLHLPQELKRERRVYVIHGPECSHIVTVSTRNLALVHWVLTNQQPPMCTNPTLIAVCSPHIPINTLQILSLATHEEQLTVAN